MSHNFKVFDENGTNMTSDSDYLANTSRSSGVSTGPADPMLYNKAQYQSSVMTTGVADFLSARGQSVSDSNLAGISAGLKNAVATPSTNVSVTIPAAGWSGGLQTVAVTGLGASQNYLIAKPSAMSEEQSDAYDAARIGDGGQQTAGNASLMARGDVPTIDIPVILVLLG